MELKASEYRRFEDIKHVREDGTEYWSARELAPALEYAKWENFSKVIGRAMIACENSGHDISNDYFGSSSESLGHNRIKSGKA